MSPSSLRPRKPALRHRVEYAFLCAGMLLLSALPRGLHSLFAEGLVAFWYYCLPIRKTVVLENLRTAFPEKSAAWRCGTARACARHFVRMAFEIAFLKRGGADALRGMVMSAENDDAFEEARAKGPVIAVSGHLGNWEVLISYFTLIRGIPFAALAKPFHNPLVEKMVHQGRIERGFEVIHTGSDMRSVLRAVRQGKVLAFLADQDARRQGVFVPFFNRPASTFTGPAIFAYRLGAPLFFMDSSRIPGTDRYRIRLVGPFLPDPSADRDAEIGRLTRLHAQCLEAAIRENPEQYFWFHKRWKTRPRSVRPAA